LIGLTLRKRANGAELKENLAQAHGEVGEQRGVEINLVIQKECKDWKAKPLVKSPWVKLRGIREHFG